MSCCSVKDTAVSWPRFGNRMEFPDELAKRFSSATLMSTPIPTVIIVVVVVPVTARFFSKLACACNLHIFLISHYFHGFLQS